MKISVVIPTYRRPESLLKCLDGLKRQTCQAEEIIVIVRYDDEGTKAVLNPLVRSFPAFQVQLIERSGVAAAMNKGLDAASGDVVAFIDDDAVPRELWIEKIKHHFKVCGEAGCVCGRDWIWCAGKSENGQTYDVGRVTWYGNQIGNHHIGSGSPRFVSGVKGVNMAFRASAVNGLRFDEHLKGSGAQWRVESSLYWPMLRRGWKILYDPAVAVDHYPAARFDCDQRNIFDKNSIECHAFNDLYVILKYFPLGKKIPCVLWLILVGNRDYPGILHFLRLLLSGDREALLRFKASMKGFIGVFSEILSKNRKQSF